MKRDQDYVLVDLLTYEKLSETAISAKHTFKNGVKVEVVHNVGTDGRYNMIAHYPAGDVVHKINLSKLHANFALRDFAELEF